MKNHVASGSTSAPRLASVELRRRVCSPVVRHRLTTFALGLWVQIVCFPAQAQQANQPGFDPRQTEKRFEDQQSARSPAGRPRLPMPQFARTAGQGDSKPLFVLQSVSITGAVAIPQDQLVTAYQPYLGKKVSQADLAAIAAAVGDIYREAGFHLSRAIVPPQDIQNGQLHLQVDRGQHHGSGVEGRRCRAVRCPADARPRVGRTAFATFDARAAIAPDQRPARRAHRRHRARGDRRRERSLPPRSSS